MIHDALITYWPLWLLAAILALGALEAWAICRSAAIADDAARRALDEHAARATTRPSPAPIDVEPAWPPRHWEGSE